MADQVNCVLTFADGSKAEFPAELLEFPKRTGGKVVLRWAGAPLFTSSMPKELIREPSIPELVAGWQVGVEAWINQWVDSPTPQTQKVNPAPATPATKFKVGDVVLVKPTGSYGKVEGIMGGQHFVHSLPYLATDLVPISYEEPATPATKFNRGDKVRHKPSGRVATVISVPHHDQYGIKFRPGEYYTASEYNLERVMDTLPPPIDPVEQAKNLFPNVQLTEKQEELIGSIQESTPAKECNCDILRGGCTCGAITPYKPTLE